MSKRIDRGARVRVVMARNDVFPWQKGPSFEATFGWGPQGAGDTFGLELEDGTPLELNGNSSEFVGLYLLEPAPSFPETL